MRGRRLEVGHGQEGIRGRLEPDQVDSLRRGPGLVELDHAQTPASQLREGHARAEVAAFGERDRVPGRKEGEHQGGGCSRTGGEEQRVAAVQLAEPAFGLRAGRVPVALVVELARLTVAVRPDRGAVDAHGTTLQAALPPLCHAFAGCTDDRGMITHKIVLALLAVAGVGASPQPGTWQRLPAAPISPEFNARTSIWTGKQ